MQTSLPTTAESQTIERKDVTRCIVRYFTQDGTFRQETKKINSVESRASLSRFIIWCVNNNIEVRISAN